MTESLSCSGPQPVDIYQGDYGYEGLFELPGVYTCVAKLEDQVSGSHEAVSSFRVMSVEELSEVATRRWDSMQASLLEGDLEGALLSFSPSARERYRSIFSVISDRMGNIATNMQQLSFYKLYGNLAIFKVRKPEVHGGKGYNITHEIHFAMNSDGIWRLSQL